MFEARCAHNTRQGLGDFASWSKHILRCQSAFEQAQVRKAANLVLASIRVLTHSLNRQHRQLGELRAIALDNTSKFSVEDSDSGIGYHSRAI